MLLFVTLVAVPAILVGARLLSYPRLQVTKRAAWALLATAFVLLALFVAAVWLMAPQGLYWRGYRSTSFLYLGLALCVYFFYLLHPKPAVPSLVTQLSALASFGLCGTALLLGWEMSDSWSRSLYYDDGRYRLEQTGRFLAGPQLPHLFVKSGVTERSYDLEAAYTGSDSSTGYDIRFPDKDSVERVRFDALRGDTLRLWIYHRQQTNAYLKNPMEFAVPIK